jgi:hypothetical protein
VKNLFLTIVVSSVLLLIGCQENSITDPVSVDPVNKTQNLSSTDTQGRFPLEGRLINPGDGLNQYFAIEGSIDYIHELVPLDPIPPAPQFFVSLKLNVNAELRDPLSPTDPIWTISDRTEDMIYVSEEGIYLLYKTFSVLGREDGLALVCRFLVTTDGVGLSEMWLVVPEGNSNQGGSLNKSSETIYPPLPPVRIDEFE